MDYTRGLCRQKCVRLKTKISLCEKCGKYLDVCKCGGVKPQLPPAGVTRTPWKTPVWEANHDIEWCRAQIALAQRGGETKPYTREEWIACMNRRIQANANILKTHGVTLSA